jgi:hypothetical protein
MSARRKRAARRQPAGPNKAAPGPDSQAPVARQKSSTSASAHRALDECLGTICLVEVTVHSLDAQEVACPEQEVLKRALKAIWFVHAWIAEQLPADLTDEGTDREDAP